MEETLQEEVIAALNDETQSEHPTFVYFQLAKSCVSIPEAEKNMLSLKDKKSPDFQWSKFAIWCSRFHFLLCDPSIRNNFPNLGITSAKQYIIDEGKRKGEKMYVSHGTIDNYRRFIDVAAGRCGLIVWMCKKQFSYLRGKGIYDKINATVCSALEAPRISNQDRRLAKFEQQLLPENEFLKQIKNYSHDKIPTHLREQLKWHPLKAFDFSKKVMDYDRTKPLQLPCVVSMTFKNPKYLKFGRITVSAYLVWVDPEIDGKTLPLADRNNYEFQRTQGGRGLFLHRICNVYPYQVALEQDLLGAWFSSLNASCKTFETPTNGWDQWHLHGRPDLPISTILLQNSFINHSSFEKPINFMPMSFYSAAQQKRLTEGFPETVSFRDLAAVQCYFECNEHQCLHQRGEEICCHQKASFPTITYATIYQEEQRLQERTVHWQRVEKVTKSKEDVIRFDNFPAQSLSLLYKGLQTEVEFECGYSVVFSAGDVKTEEFQLPQLNQCVEYCLKTEDERLAAPFRKKRALEEYGQWVDEIRRKVRGKRNEMEEFFVHKLSHLAAGKSPPHPICNQSKFGFILQPFKSLVKEVLYANLLEFYRQDIGGFSLSPDYKSLFQHERDVKCFQLWTAGSVFQLVDLTELKFPTPQTMIWTAQEHVLQSVHTNMPWVGERNNAAISLTRLILFREIFQEVAFPTSSDRCKNVMCGGLKPVPWIVDRFCSSKTADELLDLTAARLHEDQELVKSFPQNQLPDKEVKRIELKDLDLEPCVLEWLTEKSDEEEIQIQEDFKIVIPPPKIVSPPIKYVYDWDIDPLIQEMMDKAEGSDLRWIEFCREKQERDAQPVVLRKDKFKNRPPVPWSQLIRRSYEVQRIKLQVKEKFEKRRTEESVKRTERERAEH